MVLKTTKKWTNINSINSDRWYIALQLRTCITPITEKCQDMLDSEIHLSQESTHGLSKWLRKKLSMKEESLRRRSFKILRLVASPEFNLTPKLLLMRPTPTVSMIRNQACNSAKPQSTLENKLPHHMFQEELTIKTEMVLKTTYIKLKMNLTDSESQFSEPLFKTFTTPSTENFQDTPELERTLSQLVTQMVSPSLTRLPQLKKPKSNKKLNSLPPRM